MILNNDFLLQAEYLDKSGRRYSSDIGLRYIEGNSDAYFTHNSDKEDISRLTKKYGSKILELNKMLHPLHLSNSNGVPMHALENGFYYIKHQGEFSVDTVAKHFRVDPIVAKQLVGTIETKEQMQVFIDTQLERWKDEAQAAIDLINEIKRG